VAIRKSQIASFVDIQASAALISSARGHRCDAAEQARREDVDASFFKDRRQVPDQDRRAAVERYSFFIQAALQPRHGEQRIAPDKIK
jgi:hypothetical protein